MSKWIIPLPSVVISLFAVVFIFMIQFAVHQDYKIYQGPCSFVEWSTDRGSLKMKVKFDNGKEGETSDKKAYLLLEKSRTMIGELKISGDVDLKD
jgi:hypothetical protein